VGDLNFVQVLNMFLRKWWLIAIVAIVCGAATYLFCDICINETYQTDGSFYVNIAQQQEGEIISSGQLTSSTRLAVTYSELIKSRTFLEDVSAHLYSKTGKEYKAAKLKKMMDTVLNETEIIGITVKGTEPEDIYDILNCIMELAPEKITSTVGGGSVAMVDEPYVPEYPIGPNKTRNTIIGIFVGILLSLVLIFVIDLFDTRIRSSEEVRTKYKLPILGEIPQFNGDK